MLVLLLLAVGLGGVGFAHWQKGAMAIGGAAVLAALFRAVLPTREAGLLAVRSRPFDVLLLGGVGAAVVALAYVVPLHYHHTL